MRAFLKWSGIVLGALVLLVGLFLFSMRFRDGPMAVFAGGPFTSGELSAAPTDWTAIRDYDVIEFQTMEPNRSRTVWLAVHDRRLFVVSGYMNTGYGGIWKQWPHYLEDDDRIILRIDGRLYEQRLERIMSGPEVVPVLRELARKYFPGAAGDITSPESVSNGDTWMYEVVSR